MSGSGLRRWALRNLVVADGPRAGRPFRIASPPWAEVLDAMDDPQLEQVTIRGSVQSGKTASADRRWRWGIWPPGRSVLFYEPDDKLKRALAARVIAWGRACKDEVIREAYEPKRPPFARIHGRGRASRSHLRTRGRGRRDANGGGRDRGRVKPFPPRPAGRPRRPHGGLRRQGPDDHRELKRRLSNTSARRRPSSTSPTPATGSCAAPECGQENIASWANVNYKARRYPFYTMPCCGSALEGRRLPPRHAGGTLEGDQGRDGARHARLSPGRLPLSLREPANHRAPVEAGRRSPEADRQLGRNHLVPDRATWRSRTSPRPRKA